MKIILQLVELVDPNLENHSWVMSTPQWVIGDRLLVDNHVTEDTIREWKSGLYATGHIFSNQVVTNTRCIELPVTDVDDAVLHEYKLMLANALVGTKAQELASAKRTLSELTAITYQGDQ